VPHDQGQSILLTTHYMVRPSARDQIAAVDHGEVLASGPWTSRRKAPRHGDHRRYEGAVPDGLVARPAWKAYPRRWETDHD
jgi:ABC-type multidrug transport system ATPase subunit